MDNLDKVMDTWLNDESFRNEMRGDPDAALRNRDIALSDEERETLRSIDWNQPDEQLQQRVSKVYKINLSSEIKSALVTAPVFVADG